MNEEQKARTRARKTKWEREHYAHLSVAEKQRKNRADRDRYKLESPEKRKRRRALERLAWAKRKRKADLARMSPEQREHEVDRWNKLAPAKREEENTREFELHIRSRNAILDIGTDNPDHSLKEEWSYARNPTVRNIVLRRAQGKCELCGNLGFMQRSGKPYLETHHVIFLANEGKDRPSNVIALCPNDHREAHFGKRRAVIEAEMIRKLEAMNR